MNEDGSIEIAKPEPLLIELRFDPETQTVGIKFDNTKIKNWPFAKSICDAASEICKQQNEMQAAMAMQQHMAQQRQADALTRTLNGRRR